MNRAPKIAVITVCYNSAATIKDSLNSVFNQSFKGFEHIIVDGCSTDGTLAILNVWDKHPLHLISEPDSGIYDAMNKGISLATADIIGILNSDDMYASPDVLEMVSEVFNDPTIDACYSDLVYVDRYRPNRIIRYWKSNEVSYRNLSKGWVPPHPTFFVRRSVYEQYGMFDLNYKIAADYEIMMRFIAMYKIKCKYMPKVTIKMRMGGTTNKSITNIFKQNVEIYSAAKKNDVHLSKLFILHKLREKMSQYFSRPE